MYTSLSAYREANSGGSCERKGEKCTVCENYVNGTDLHSEVKKYTLIYVVMGGLPRNNQVETSRQVQLCKDKLQ